METALTIVKQEVAHCCTKDDRLGKAEGDHVILNWSFVFQSQIQQFELISGMRKRQGSYHDVLVLVIPLCAFVSPSAQTVEFVAQF